MCEYANSQDTVRILFSDALSELIECYLGEHEIVDTPDMGSRIADITAIVGLGDQQISAAVALTTTEEEAGILAGNMLSSPIDWIGELGNQLAGRLKNKLCMYGLQPRLSTPTIVRGQRIEVSSPGRTVYALVVHTPSVRVLAQITLEIDPNLTLLLDQSAALMTEGELTLF